MQRVIATADGAHRRQIRGSCMADVIRHVGYTPLDQNPLRSLLCGTVA